MTNPYPQPYSPEHRVWELAQKGSGKTEAEVLDAAGWVAHDGTLLRDDLLAQYRREAEQADRAAEGISMHAADWAFNGMRSSLEVAQAYGKHMEQMWRSGEMTPETSHKVEYPAFVAAQEAEQQEHFIGQFKPGYAHAMLWANTEAVRDGEPTGEQVHPEEWQTPADGWQVDAFTPGSRQQIDSDSRDFVLSNWADLKDLDPGQAGHDFALSRNGHGAGFFDRGLGDKGTRLQDAARVYGESSAWFDAAEHENGQASVRLMDEPEPDFEAC